MSQLIGERHMEPIPQTNAALAGAGQGAHAATAEVDIFETPEGQELLEQIAAFGFGMMMQSMSQTMAEVNKVATSL